MTEWLPVVASLTALLAAGAALWKSRSEVRQAKAEARKAAVVTDAEVDRMLREAREELERERVALGVEVRERRTLEGLVAELRQRIRHLENTLPLALMAPRLLAPLQEELADVLDECSDLVAVTSNQDGGRFLWLNSRWEELLGWERGEMLGMGWRALVHPDDLAVTSRVEGSAWVRRAEVVNRYRTKAGGWVTLRWIAAEYQGGVSFALARVVDPGGS